MGDVAGGDAAAAGPASGAKADGRSSSAPPSPKKARRGILSRIWKGIFGVRADDYEKRLQYLSKEEALVHARMKRRGLSARRMARNIIALSVVMEIVAVAYAIMTTRSVELNWKMRAVRVLPMFLLPGLSSVIYSALLGFTRMLDRNDQKMLERLRAERKAKIDELKERTNYYSTQQLIQRYDLDPAAKAAAAAVLASKLGADSGLKVYLGDESKTDVASAKSNAVEPVQSSGLRNRRQSNASNNSTGSSVISEVSGKSHQTGMDNQQVVQAPVVVEHFTGTGPNNGGFISRIAALLVGEDPSQSYALICGNCHMHNGLARKEDFPYITYYCPHCLALNRSRQLAEVEQESSSSSGKAGQPYLGGDYNAQNVKNSSSVPDNETMAASATAQEKSLGED